MENSIKFEIQVKAKDLWQFTMYHTNRGALGLFNIIFTLAAVFLLLSGWKTATGMYRFTLLFCALIFTVLQPLQLYHKAKRQAKQPALREPMTLEFDEEGLSVYQLDQEVKFSWEQIGRIDKKPTMIIVYMDRIHAYLIPKTDYMVQEDAFFKLLRAHLPKARRKRI